MNIETKFAREIVFRENVFAKQFLRILFQFSSSAAAVRRNDFTHGTGSGYGLRVGGYGLKGFAVTGSGLRVQGYELPVTGSGYAVTEYRLRVFRVRVTGLRSTNNGFSGLRVFRVTGLRGYGFTGLRVYGVTGRCSLKQRERLATYALRMLPRRRFFSLGLDTDVL